MGKKVYIVLIMIFILLNINILSALEFGLYPKNNQDYSALLIGLVPLVILFAISMIFIKSRKTGLYYLQKLLWFIYFFYYLVTFIVWFHEYANMGLLPNEIIKSLNHISINEISYLFLLSIIINLTISFFLSFKNAKTLKYFIR